MWRCRRRRIAWRRTHTCVYVYIHDQLAHLPLADPPTNDTRFPPSKWGTEELSNLACHHRFKDCIEAQDPDLVISVHPLCQDVPLRVLNTIGDGT